MRPLHKLVLVTSLWLASCSQGGGRPIVVGLAGPFSQPRGVSMQRAAELAVKEINARGGLHGRPLALRVMDDSGRADVAIRVAQALADDPEVVAVIGHLTSGTSLAGARVYGAGRRPVAMISPSASSADLSGVNPYTFRVCPTDLSHGAQLARYARQTLGARRAGIIYIDDDYGRGLRLSFATEFRRLGGTVVEEDPSLATTASLEPYLARLRQGGADVLMLATERGGAELALRDEGRLGLRWPTIGGDALTGIEAAGPVAEGVRVSSAYLADRPGDRNGVFVAAYARAYEGQRPDHRGAGAYDILQLLATRVFAAAGTDRRAVRDYLARIGTDLPAYEGVTGTIAFDGRGDVPAKSVVVGVVRGGRIVTEAAQ